MKKSLCAPTAPLHKRMWLTNTQREGAVPSPPFPPQAGEHLGAFQGVARITAVRHSAPCKMAFVLSLVAKQRNPWILTPDQFKALWGEREREGWGSTSRRTRRILKNESHLYMATIWDRAQTITTRVKLWGFVCTGEFYSLVKWSSKPLLLFSALLMNSSHMELEVEFRVMSSSSLLVNSPSWRALLLLPSKTWKREREFIRCAHIQKIF